MNLRIISGKWRNFKLDFSHSSNLRPTPERIRETVFNWLFAEINNAKVLDCFAGTGVFALEALSRGAKSACIIEKSAKAIKNIKSNINRLAGTNIEIINNDCLRFLQHNQDNKIYDIVFIDPPYYKNIVEQVCSLLQANKFLHANSLIYIETEASLAQLKLPDSWQLKKHKQSKNIKYQLWAVS